MKQQPNVPVNLTHAQRRVLAGVLPALADRLKIDEAASRTISFTLKEIREIAAKCQAAVPKAENGMIRNSLRHITDAATKAIENSQGIGGIPSMRNTSSSWNGAGRSIPRRSTPKWPRRRCGRACRTGGR